MDRAEVRRLQAQGVGFGSHSSAHRVLAACDAPRLEQEIAGNRSFLEQELQIRSEHFAIPFGKKAHYTPAVLASLARNGYRHAYTTNPSFVPADAGETPRRVPRIGVTNEDPATLLFYLNRPLLKRVDL